MRKKRPKKIRVGRHYISQKNPKKVPPMSYGTYITSAYWKARKIRYYHKYGKQCGICNSTEKIHLHHIVYDKFGKEPDENLIALCALHHNEYHRLYGVKKNNKETYEYARISKKVLRDVNEHDKSFNEMCKNF